MKSIKFFAVGFCAMVLCLLSGKNANANTSVGCNPDPSIRASELITAVQNAVNAGGAQFVDLSAGCVYTLTQVNSGTGVDLNGLPVITNSVALTITGNGASIVRDQAAPQFRFLDVMSGSQLALISLTLRGGHAVDGPPITMTHSVAGHGGAIQNTGELILNHATLLDNRAGDSACKTGNESFCLDKTIYYNFEPGSGGGIYSSGYLLVVDSSIIANQGGKLGLGDAWSLLSNGGGIVNAGVAKIAHSVFISNQTGLCSSCFSENFGGNGGAIFNFGDLTITNSNIMSNTASIYHNSSPRGGGGISSVSGSVKAKELAIIFNKSVDGSAVHVNGGDFDLSNSTLFSNDGGSVVFSAFSVFTITNTTIVPSPESYNYGFGTPGGKFLINNSIIAGPCTFWGAAEGNYNILHPSCSVSSTILGSNFYPISMGLDPVGPKDNGGDTSTIALMPSSPAINFVPLAACTLSVDQRGTSRPQGEKCDAGAYEFQAQLRAFLPIITHSWTAGW